MDQNQNQDGHQQITNSVQNVEKKYYKKNKKVGKQFDLVFDQIKGSLIDSNILNKGLKLAGWKLSELVYGNQSWPYDQKELQQKLPMTTPTFETNENKIVYTWIGHSTAVISIGQDFNIIIDPVFSDRASFSQSVGPIRFRKPACQIKNLPKIHIVLISHDHYDHLDLEAIKQIYQLNPNALFVAGEGSRSMFPNFCDYKQLNWTQEGKYKVGDKYKEVQVSITFVPACHWSRRGVFDYNARLWGGFAIKTPKGKKIFYSGDTGYCGVFKQIGKQFGGFDLSILPIGAYQPRHLLQNQHVNPEQAVKIHKDIQSKKSVGVHWGTFPLGSQHYTAARDDLIKACEKYKLEKDEFITIPHGGNFEIDY